MKGDNKMEKICIVGGGSWAIALVKVLTEKNININWWIRRNEVITHIKAHHHHSDYLCYVYLITKRINFSTDLNKIINDSDIIFWAVPGAFLHKTISGFKLMDLTDKFHVSLIKGIVPEFNCSATEYLKQQYNIPGEKFAVVSGPCHAEEVAMEKLSSPTIVASNQKLCRIVSELLSCRYIKVNILDDMRGIEYAGIIKNIFAIAAGICSGLGYGDNFLAILATNAIKEIKIFLDTICPTKRDIFHSVYTGDIIVTMYSQFSRNRTFGTLIGKGYTVQYSVIEMKMVAEGYYAVKGIKEIANDLQIKTPIINAVYNILYQKSPPNIEIKLMVESFV